MAKTTVGAFTEFVGRRIKLRRKAKNMTQEELARRIGVSVTVLNMMEHGLCHINLEQLMQCVRYLTATNDLLGLPHYGDDDMKMLIDARVNAMSEEQLRNWKAQPQAPDAERRRLFIVQLDTDDET